MVFKILIVLKVNLTKTQTTVTYHSPSKYQTHTHKSKIHKSHIILDLNKVTTQFWKKTYQKNVTKIFYNIKVTNQRDTTNEATCK